MAQSRAMEISTHTQSWFSINCTKRLNNNRGLITDVHTRRKDSLAGESFYFARLGVNYWLKPNLTLAAGYTHRWLVPTKPGW